MTALMQGEQTAQATWLGFRAASVAQLDGAEGGWMEDVKKSSTVQRFKQGSLLVSAAGFQWVEAGARKRGVCQGVWWGAGVDRQGEG